VAVDGRVWTGTDGVYIVDQMQYLAWIRSASHHLLVSNMFVLHGTPADYFQPAIVLSAVLVALGVAPQLALLLWKPIAVALLFIAFRRYVHRSVAGTTERRVALVLALFFGSYSLVYGSWSLVGDLMPLFLSWGYTFALVAIAMMALALLGYDRARERRAVAWAPGLLGAGASLLHPWQGELMIAIIAMAEAAMWWTGGRRIPTGWRTTVATIGLTGLALLYYEILGRADVSWQLARDASKHAFSLTAILIGVVPLLVPALVGLRPRRVTFLAMTTRAWLVAAFGVWVLSASALSATPLHAFQGITLPLAVLAVEGVARLRLERVRGARLLLVPAVALFTIPATIKLMSIGHQLAKPTQGNANFIAKQDRQALRYLAKTRERGGVLTRSYLGAVVPALTDRNTYIGDCLWSEPNCLVRTAQVQSLVDRTMPVEQAREFVRRTGARFVLTDCQDPADLTDTLGPLVQSVHRFGCAAVYELAPSSEPPDTLAAASGPLAESGRDAALRASWR
jgi:hypothetical protein